MPILVKTVVGLNHQRESDFSGIIGDVLITSQAMSYWARPSLPCKR